MSSAIGTAFVEIRPETTGFAGRLRGQLVKPAGDAGDEAGKAAGQGVERGFQSASGRLGGAFTSVFAGLTHAAILAGAAGGAAIAGLGGWGLKSAADMQQVEIAFEGILGSGEKAKAFLDQLKAFAAVTPFEFPELATAAKQLLAVGFNAEQVIPIMTDLGNVAATLGAGGEQINLVVRALGQMKGKGKTSAEELQQISESLPGFSSVAAIAAARGETVAQVFDELQAGAISADEGIAAIIQGMHNFNGAAGAMEKQSKTLNGVLSTLKDTARDALVAGIAPILPTLAGTIEAAVPDIKQALSEIGRITGTFLTTMAGTFSKLLPVIADTLGPVADVLGTAFKEIGRILGVVGPQIAGLFRDIAPDVQRFVQALGPLIAALIQSLLPAFHELAPAILGVATKLAISLVPVVVALTPVITALANVLVRVIDVLGPFGILAVGLAIKAAALIPVFTGAGASIAAMAATTVTASTVMNAAVPIIAAFTAGFVATTLVLEAVFGKADKLGPKLDELEQRVASLTKVADSQLRPAFDQVIRQFQETHPILTRNTAVFAAFEQVARENLGTAIRLAEQYKENTTVYNEFQHVIANVAREQSQTNADLAAGANAADVLAAALSKIHDVDATVTVHVNPIDLSGLQQAQDLTNAGVPGFAAAGAHTRPGEPFVVGEKGPELFVPDQAGTIVPNDQVTSAASVTGGGIVIEHLTMTQPATDPVRFAVAMMRKASLAQWAGVV